MLCSILHARNADEHGILVAPHNTAFMQVPGIMDHSHEQRARRRNIQAQVVGGKRLSVQMHELGVHLRPVSERDIYDPPRRSISGSPSPDANLYSDAFVASLTLS
jgi:hypothetical protein